MHYVFGDCELDTCLYTLQRSGRTIRLRPKVFRVCLYLLEHRERVVSREELCAQVWAGQFISQTTLEGVIRAVRQAVGDNGRAQSIIQTLYGYGYRFVADVAEGLTNVAAMEAPPVSDVPIIQGASSLGQTAGGSTSVASAPAPEATPQPIWTDKPNHGTTFEEWHTADSCAGIDPVEQQTAGPRQLARRSMVHVMQALAVLILSLLGGWALWQGVPERAVAPFEKSRIAVLPFLNLSAEADRAYLADGMTEQLIAQLAQVPGLTVTARTSVMKYKGSMKDIASIARELRVGTILEGSIRTMDNQMRINAQLIDVVSQGHLWSQEYDREHAGGIAIQSEIATQVAQQLTVQLTARAKQSIKEQGTETPDAYTFNLQGR